MHPLVPIFAIIFFFILLVVMYKAVVDPDETLTRGYFWSIISGICTVLTTLCIDSLPDVDWCWIPAPCIIFAITLVVALSRQGPTLVRRLQGGAGHP